MRCTCCATLIYPLWPTFSAVAPKPEGRACCRRLWRTALVERSLPFIDIRGPYGQRLATAIAAVEKP